MRQFGTHISASIGQRVVARDGQRTNGGRRIRRNIQCQFVVFRAVVVEDETDGFQIARRSSHYRCIVCAAAVQRVGNFVHRDLRSFQILNQNAMDGTVARVAALVRHVVVAGDDNRAAAGGVGIAVYGKVAGLRAFIGERHAKGGQLALLRHFSRCVRGRATRHSRRVEELRHLRSHRVGNHELVGAVRFAFVGIHYGEGHGIGAVAYRRVNRDGRAQAVIHAHFGIRPSNNVRSQAVEYLRGHHLRPLVRAEKRADGVNRHSRNRRRAFHRDRTR